MEKTDRGLSKGKCFKLFDLLVLCDAGGFLMSAFSVTISNRKPLLSQT